MATRKTTPTNSTEETNLSRADIERLLEVIHDQKIEEFELEQGGTRLRVVANTAKEAPPVQIVQSQEGNTAESGQVTATSSTPGGSGDSDDDSRYKKITSPMVGTFYRSSSPAAKPYVEVGDKVDEDSVLCIIEAMKLMNEIKAECRGHVKKILVENAQPVEYGQVLFLIEPS